MPDEYVHLGPNEAINEGDTLPDTVAPIGDESYGDAGIEKEDRFAVTPLYTRYHKYALDGEYMVDKNTGAPAIKRENGSIVSIHEISRMKQHMDLVTGCLCYLGLRNTSIYNALYNDESEVTVYDRDNMLDEPIELNPVDGVGYITNVVLSTDLSILESFSVEDKFLHLSGLDPLIHIKYIMDDGDTEEEVSFKMSELPLNPITLNNAVKLTITKIWAPEIDESPQYETFIHSILIAY